MARRPCQPKRKVTRVLVDPASPVASQAETMRYHRARLLDSFHTRSMYAETMMIGTGTGAVSMTLGALRSLMHGSDSEGSIVATDLGTRLSFFSGRIDHSQISRLGHATATAEYIGK